MQPIRQLTRAFNEALVMAAPQAVAQRDTAGTVELRSRPSPPGRGPTQAGSHTRGGSFRAPEFFRWTHPLREVPAADTNQTDMALLHVAAGTRQAGSPALAVGPLHSPCGEISRLLSLDPWSERWGENAQRTSVDLMVKCFARETRVTLDPEPKQRGAGMNSLEPCFEVVPTPARKPMSHSTRGGAT